MDILENTEIDVSVIMLTYNHEDYIAQAIESVLMQETSLRYELLIGDDASTDRTPEIVREYAEKYPDIIRPVLREKNLGANRNNYELHTLTKGKYIASIEGDDYWLDTHKLQKQYEFLESHPEYSSCFGKSVVVDKNGRPDYTQTPGFVMSKKVYTLADYIDFWKMPAQGSTGMNRNYFRGDGLKEFSVVYESNPQVGDKTVMLLLLSAGDAYCSNDVLAAYRRVREKNGGNYFSRHYGNPYRNHDMFLYSCALEDIARARYGIREELGKRQKKTRFCRFAEECFREPSLKKAVYLAEMLARSHAPGKYAWYALKTLIEME